jgi:hypothetical protein
MPIRQLSEDQLRRLKLLCQLPDDALVPTRDAALLSGVGSLPTWQRLKSLGRAPRARVVNGNSHAFRVGDCKRMAAIEGAEAEEPEAA